MEKRTINQLGLTALILISINMIQPANPAHAWIFLGTMILAAALTVHEMIRALRNRLK